MGQPERPETATLESVIADTVRAWAAAAIPGDDRVARIAAATALACYAEGRSVAEACEAGGLVIGAWSDHPSQPRPARLKLAAAS